MTEITAAARPRRLPMVGWILIGLVAGLVFGLAVRGFAASAQIDPLVAALKGVSGFVLGLLRLLATPLIFVAILSALVRAEVSGRSGGRLLWLLATNTLAAILIGLLVANLLRPGDHASLPVPSAVQKAEIEAKPHFDPLNDFVLKSIPKNLVDPFRDNDTVGIIALALALGAAIRTLRSRGGTAARHVDSLMEILQTVFDLILVLLHWLFGLVPLAVFAVVASVVAKNGLQPLVAMGWFVISVLLALLLQAGFYITRLRLGSWVRPRHFLRSAAEALTVAFSTASSTATLPVTYRCAVEKLGVRPASAGLGVMVGGSMNNDGTALYEAMAALFVAQVLGQHLGLGAQTLLIVMAVIASVGAAGIPEAGLITMIAVFTAVRLPVEYIPLLLSVDWFLDRCRTAINVMGDLTVTGLLDGQIRATPPPGLPEAG